MLLLHNFLHDTTQPEKVISVNEFKDVFFSLKVNKSAGYMMTRVSML